MYKQRTIYPEIVKHLDKKQFTVITGARQTGKTTILKQLYLHLKEKGEKVWYITFENESVLNKININPENIFLFSLRPANPLEKLQKPPHYILIDEVQYANDPSNFLKLLYDTYSPNLKVVATGSSSFYMDRKFKDSLSGRKKIFILRTFGFEEFLHFKDNSVLLDELKQIRQNEEYVSIHYQELKQNFDEYLKFGGYPEVVLSDDLKDKIAIIDEIKNSYIKRDIHESKVENEQKFYQLLSILSLQTGNLVNKFELSKILRTDIKTVERYITVLQKCFHISLIRPFHQNKKKELVKMPKVYFNDLGMRNLLVNNFNDTEKRPDRGQLLENYVFIRLLEKHNEDEIKFWRTADKKEVDFVVTPQLTSPFALEVKFSAVTLKKKRYKSFTGEYPDIPLKFVTYDTDTGYDKEIVPAIKI